MCLKEALAERRQYRAGNIGGGGDAQQAARLAARRRQPALPGIERVQCFNAGGKVGLAGLGHMHAAGGALDQRYAEPLLQARDFGRHSGARHAEQPGGSGEAALLHHPDEDVDAIEIHRTIMQNSARSFQR